MMAKVIGMTPEGIDWISSNFGSSVRDRKLPFGSTRKERLLGLAACGHPSLSEPSDVNELIEEDVWGDEFLVPDRRKDDMLFSGVKEKADTVETARKFGSYRRRLSVDRDSSLSLAFGETGRTRVLSALTSLNRGSGHSPGHGSNREGTQGRISTASRLIPHIGIGADNGRFRAPQSAPLRVPDWSAILGIDEKARDQDNFVDFDDDDGERLPPHELLDLEYARNRIITFSVFEGVGRTLKGRDLSRVRNAVLRQTGFIE